MSKRARDPKAKRTPPRGPRIIRKGQCKRCGECCHMDRHSKQFRKMEIKTFDARLAMAIKDGHTEAYPLNPICAHLRKLRDGTFVCAIYPTRPMGCRKWPTHPNQLRNIPGCAYTFEIVSKRPTTKAELTAERERYRPTIALALEEGN